MPSRLLLGCALLVALGCTSDKKGEASGAGSGGMAPAAGQGSGGAGGTANRAGAGNGATAGNAGNAVGGGAGRAGTSGSDAGGGRGGTASGMGGSAGGMAANGGTSGAALAGTGSDGGSAGSRAGAGNAGTSGVPAKNPVVYIGGSGSNNSYPFTTYDFDLATGALTARTQTTDLGPSPSYIALAPSKEFLVVTNERDDTAGGLTSATIASDGTLTMLNHMGGTDGGFTYVTIHPSGYALAASYNGGSLSVFPVADDGKLSAQGANEDFGAMAQTHCVAFDSGGTHLFVPNKGNDEVAQLLFDEGAISPNDPPRVDTADGAGPRHIALHPNGKLAFVINELDSTMTPYQVSAGGTLNAGTSVSTLPAGFNGQNTGAHVEVSPDGRFVYGSNRGHDSIVVFSVDQTSGALTLVQHQPSGGQTPRDFDMDPYGRFIVVANQGNSKVAAFAIGDDGKLTVMGNAVNGPSGCSAVQVAYLP